MQIRDSLPVTDESWFLIKFWPNQVFGQFLDGGTLIWCEARLLPVCPTDKWI